MADDFIIPDSVRQRAAGGGQAAAPAEAPKAEDVDGFVIPDSVKRRLEASRPPPAPPKAPEKPGLIDRAASFLGEGRSKPDSTLAGITPEQARGITGDAEPQGLAAVGPRPGGPLAQPNAAAQSDPMLRPEFIEQVRNRFSNVPAHMRLPALREYAKTNDVNGRAARQILAEVEGQNSRITPDDERVAATIQQPKREDRMAVRGKLPAVEDGPAPRTTFPDATPTFGDTMDGVGRAEVAQRRLTAQKVAEAGKPTMRDAKGAVAQKRLEQESPVAGTWLETPWNLYASGAAGMARMVATGAGLVDAMSSEGSMRQELAAGLAEWANGTADELGAQQSRKLKQEAVEFGRLIEDEKSSVADMAGYLVTRPELFASKFSESVIPMLLSGLVGRAAGAGAAARSQIALGGASNVTPAAAAKISQIAGNASVAGAVVTEAAQIAGGVYNKAIEDGLSRDAAQRSAGNAFLGALAIGKMAGGGAAGAVAAKRSGAMREAANEFGEEYAQTWLETLAPALGAGQDIDVAKANKEAVAGGLIGAGVGGATGGMNSLAAFLTPKAKDGAPLKPSEARAASIDRFGELAAGFGLPERALTRAREAAANMPAGNVPKFLADLADVYNERGMFSKPLDPAAISELQTAIDGPPEEPTLPSGKPGGDSPNKSGVGFSGDATQQTEAVDNIAAILKNAGLVDETLATPGLADATPDTPVDAVWLSAEADVPVQVVGPAQPGPDGREYTPVVGPDGEQSFLPADELIEADRKAADDQSVVPVAPAVAAGTADAGGAAGPRGSSDPRPDAAVDGRSDPAAAAPVPGGGTAGAVGDGGGPDAALSDAQPIADLRKRWPGLADKPDAHVRAAQAWSDAQGRVRAAYEYRGNKDGEIQDALVEEWGQKRIAADQVGYLGELTKRLNAEADRMRALRDTPGTLPNKRQQKQDEEQRAQSTEAMRKAIAQDIDFNLNRVREMRRQGRINDADEARLLDLARSSKDGFDAAMKLESFVGGKAMPSDVAPVGRADEAANAAPAARQLGSYGRTPGNATPIELRPNADGTLTPYTGKYPMVDYESGDPIVIPADASDAEAVDAIRAAKAVVPKDKFFGLKGASKGDAAPAAQPDTVADADPVQADAEAPAQTQEQQVAAARKRIDGLKALLSCLSK